MGQRLDTLLLLMLWGATMLPLTSILAYHATRKGIHSDAQQCPFSVCQPTRGMEPHRYEQI
jgi:hypothetical protein